MSCLRLMAPDEWERLWADAKASGLEVPSHQTLSRARIRLDAARCLWERRVRSRTENYRYMYADASPIGGREYFAVRCDILPTEAAGREVDFGRLRSVLAPLACLGHGRATAAGKAAALLWQLFLEDGPSLRTLQRAAKEVRTFTSDLGVESMLVDCRVPLQTLLAGLRRGGLPSEAVAEWDLEQGEYLFENAFGIPGVQHLVDWVAQECTRALSFWPAWVAAARRIAGLLGHAEYREKLWHFLKQSGARLSTGDLAAPQLQSWSANLAHWRWQTLHEMTSSLVRVREALCLAWQLQAASDDGLRCREEGLLAGVHAAVTSREFWQRNELLHGFHSQLDRFRRWATGCPCHEEAPLASCSASLFVFPPSGLSASTSFSNHVSVSFPSRVTLLLDGFVLLVLSHNPVLRASGSCFVECPQNGRVGKPGDRAAGIEWSFGTRTCGFGWFCAPSHAPGGAGTRGGRRMGGGQGRQAVNLNGSGVMARGTQAPPTGLLVLLGHRGKGVTVAGQRRSQG